MHHLHAIYATKEAEFQWVAHDAKLNPSSL